MGIERGKEKDREKKYMEQVRQREKEEEGVRKSTGLEISEYHFLKLHIKETGNITAKI